jgi:lactoylglutathione lyase
MEYLHTMVRVRDLDESLSFYCDKLGLKEIRRVENEKGRFTLVFLAAPGDQDRAQSSAAAPMLELTYNWDTEDYDGGRNFGHVAFAVDDIYALCESLKSKGVIINRPPRDGWMAFIRSPDGISVELLQKGEHLLGRPCPIPEAGSKHTALEFSVLHWNARRGASNFRPRFVELNFKQA